MTISAARCAGLRRRGAGDGSAAWLHRREADRLESLASYRVFGMPGEPADEAAARLAALACAAPAAMVCLVGREHLWVKASYGLHAMSGRPPRANSPCSDTVALGSALVIEDVASDQGYADCLGALGAPKIRAFAGVPLVGRDGLALGTLCVLDFAPRAFSRAQLENLAALAESVVTRLELRRVDWAMGRDPDALLADALDPLRLRQAVEEGEFTCHFQPIVLLDSGAARAFEALVRWHHPSLGVIPPALFLPAMERTGLMHGLGRSVLYQALDLAGELGQTEEGRGVPKVAVNVSGTQLETPGLADLVAEALAGRCLPAETLCIEVTESVPLERGCAAAELAALRALGVGVALDDYGAGNATANKVLELPVTALKLDRSLTAAVAQSARSRAVVRSSLEMAEQIGLEVSCEGVENAAQRDALMSVGATIGQGWHFSMPLERTQLMHYLARCGCAPSDQERTAI